MSDTAAVPASVFGKCSLVLLNGRCSGIDFFAVNGYNAYGELLSISTAERIANIRLTTRYEG